MKASKEGALKRAENKLRKEAKARMEAERKRFYVEPGKRFNKQLKK